jgi:Fe2+ or Zn2+ uptake regulation protein
VEHDFSPALKAINLKKTPKRLAILEILRQEHIYLSPEEVWFRMQKSFKKIGLPTVYRNLEDLAEGGILIKIIHPDRRLYYYLCENTLHHHHFVCIACRRVDDLKSCCLHEIEEEVEKDLEGEVQFHLMQVQGYCKDCRRKP